MASSSVCGDDAQVTGGAPSSVRKLLPRVLGQLATETGDARHLKMLWELAVGPVIARQSSPVSLRDGIVVVKVGSPRWKAELEQREADLRSRLIHQLDDVRVTRLQFTLDVWGR